MNLDTSFFIKNLITGTIDYLKEINFELSSKHEKKLESVLMSELNKDFELQRKQFGKLASKFNLLKQSHPQLDTLSMGMSDDFEEAITFGANSVRIGSAIFGQRES